MINTNKIMTNKKKIMVSGIQPTNNLTLGNYLGAIKNFITFQDEYQMYIFIADLHAITTNQAIDLKSNRINIAKIHLALGLDISKVTIFNQSDVLEHTLLSHILLCRTNMGELSRMTQFKDKAKKCKQANGTDYIPTGLLIYPGLMAADILLYDTDVVMVGADQKQHLELTQRLAEKFNSQYKQNVFTVPSFFTVSETTKIMDLLDATKKMSKSSENPKGVIFLNDDPKVAYQKIMNAITDNFNIVKHNIKQQPGITNLINIYCGLTNKSIKAVEEEFKNIKNYGEFKKVIAQTLSDFLSDLQVKIKKLDDAKLDDILRQGAHVANKKARDKMNIVLNLIGLK